MQGTIHRSRPTPSPGETPSRAVDVERVRRFLAWLVPLIFGFALAEVIVGSVLVDLRSFAIGVLIGAYGCCLLWARAELDRGRLETATTIACLGLVVPDLAILALEPALVTTLILVPLLAVSLILPFVSRRSLSRVFAGVWAWTVGVAVLAEVLPASPDVAPGFDPLFRVAAAGTAAAMILLLLGQFRDRLVRSADAERAVADGMREIDEMKDAFLQAASHDLRSPTTTILGAARTLKIHGLVAGEAEALVDSIDRQARKLEGLLDDLLDVERLRRGELGSARDLLDLGEVVGGAMAGVDVPADRTVTVEVASVLLPIDPIQVERIVENLVANAFRHTSEGTPVWVCVLPVEGGGEIRVEDAGGGVDPALREELFEPFRRGPGADAVPGTGVGLSLVARFAEIHGGHASVTERDGGGASFRVFLPDAA